jgi:hypothetical protein
VIKFYLSYGYFFLLHLKMMKNFQKLSSIGLLLFAFVYPPLLAEAKASTISNSISQQNVNKEENLTGGNTEGLLIAQRSGVRRRVIRRPVVRRRVIRRPLVRRRVIRRPLVRRRVIRRPVVRRGVIIRR